MEQQATQGNGPVRGERSWAASCVTTLTQSASESPRPGRPAGPLQMPWCWVVVGRISKVHMLGTPPATWPHDGGTTRAESQACHPFPPATCPRSQQHPPRAAVGSPEHQAGTLSGAPHDSLTRRMRAALGTTGRTVRAGSPGLVPACWDTPKKTASHVPWEQGRPGKCERVQGRLPGAGRRQLGTRVGRALQRHHPPGTQRVIARNLSRGHRDLVATWRPGGLLARLPLSPDRRPGPRGADGQRSQPRLLPSGPTPATQSGMAAHSGERASDSLSALCGQLPGTRGHSDTGTLTSPVARRDRMCRVSEPVLELGEGVGWQWQGGLWRGRVSVSRDRV